MKPSILLADDNAPLLASVGLALREAGYPVTSTSNGADAICLLGQRPGLVILDVNMPSLDGYAVLRTLGPSAPPVLLITGSDIDERQFDPSKVSRVLRKPFDLTALMTAVEEALAADRNKPPVPENAPPTPTSEPTP